MAILCGVSVARRPRAGVAGLALQTSELCEEALMVFW